MAKSLRCNEHEIIGFSTPLPENVLPTKADVVKRLQLSKDNLELTTGKQKIPVSEIIKPVVGEIIEIWEKASIPTVAVRGIERALGKLWDQSKQGLKNEQYKTQTQDKNQKLFDICACKCQQILCGQAGCISDNCDDIHLDCKCDSSKKVPAREHKFLFDQRCQRQMMMSGLDQKVTHSLKGSQKKEAAFEARQEREKKRVRDEAESNANANREFFAEQEDCDDDTKDMDWMPDASISEKGPQTRNRHALPRTGAACDRWGISSRAAADIVNSYAMDIGFLTDSNKSTVIVDKSKLDRWRKVGRFQTQEQEKQELVSKSVSGVYLDGKQDCTLTRVQKDGKFYQKNIIEDHYVMLGEPGNVYLGHEVPYSGHGISIGLKIFRSLKSKGLAKDILVVGADGCNVNVGNNEGALVYLEKLLGRPLHWYICMLHGCELPLRAIVRTLDGGTSGPLTLKGPIGSTLNEDLTELAVVDFQSIPNPDFPTVAEEVSYELSKDQAYLYNMCQAVMKGELPIDLAHQEPGPLNNARWLTLANRLLRKYASTPRPSKKFQEIIHSIIHFYGPSWFQIKTHPKCVDGPRNFFKQVQYQQKLGKELQKVVQKSMQRNGFFAHVEAILITMLNDPNPEIRAIAVNIILTIRMKRANQANQAGQNASQDDDRRGVDEESNSEQEDGDADFQLDPSEKQAIATSNIRRFIIPKINFQASSYHEMIDWEDTVLTEPPLTLSLTDDQISAFKETPFDVPDYPCHTQAVERGIRLVSEAAAAVIGPDARDGFIRQRIKERKELKKFSSKKDFFPKVEAANLS